MRLVLINPRSVGASTFPSGEFFDCTAPNMGLAYLAASLLAAGHEVEIIEAQALKLDDEALRASLSALHPDVIGSTATTTTLNNAIDAITIAKELHPEAFTILGGVHASYLPLQTLTEFPQLDAVCIGEGEATIVELLGALENREDLAGVDGIAFRRNGTIERTKPRTVRNRLDDLALPARHLLPLETYAAGGVPHRTASVVSSRGCPFRCAFCATPSIAGSRYRARSPESLIQEIEQLVQVHNLTSFQFVDDLFTLDNDRVRTFCRQLIQSGMSVNWSCSARADTVNPELLHSMAAAGCQCISYGIESGSSRILGAMKKGETLEQMMDAVRWTREAGMKTWGFFILGFPDETRAELEQTIRFAGELELDFAEFFIATAFPGSALYEYVKDTDLLTMTDWSDVAYGCPTIRNRELSEVELKDYLVRAYRDFYTSPRVLARLEREGQERFIEEILLQVT